MQGWSYRRLAWLSLVTAWAPGCDGTNSVGSGSVGGTGVREPAPIGGARSSATATEGDDWGVITNSSYGGTTASSTQARQYSYQLPTGFERYAELGDDCAAAYATNPQTALGQLTFIPCTSGTPDCEQMVTSALGGATPPTDVIVGGGYAYQVARDADGNFNRLLVEYVPDSLDDRFQSAVVLDVATGKLVAGWRNALNDVLVARPGTSQSSVTLAANTMNLACEIHPFLGRDTVWVIARPAHSSTLKVVHSPLTNPASATQFVALEADESALSEKTVASDEALAVAQSDGKITVMYADGRQVSTYGPSMRVWLHSVEGTDVITYNDQGTTGTKYFKLDSQGQFTPIATAAVLLVVDGKQAAWSAESTTSGLEKMTTPIWTAQYTAWLQGDAGAATLLTSFESDPIFDGLCSPILTNGLFSVATNCKGYMGVAKVYSTDLSSGAVRVTTMPEGVSSAGRYEDALAVYAVTDSRVWFARKSLGETYYYELQRLKSGAASK